MGGGRARGAVFPPRWPRSSPNQGAAEAGQNPELGAHALKYSCGFPVPSEQKNFCSASFSTVNPLQLIVCPGDAGHVARALPQLKITDPQSNPLGQSESAVHSMPQNEPV